VFFVAFVFFVSAPQARDKRLPSILLSSCLVSSHHIS